ncbi:MAG: hydroxyacid dehydrogenase [Desulfovibrio sp.]|jgi:(S)-sulfolactate dehydrogenase|nr:hydroxyacid dehydrogenase [Desulfovibrio sp.]
MADILITEFIDAPALKKLQNDFDVVYDATLVDKPDEAARLIVGCPALIVRNRTQVRGSLLAHADALKVVGRLGVGLDNIDLSLCKERGITVFPATGANAISVAEYVLCGVLTMIRGCYGDSASVASGQWPRTRQMGGEAYGKTLGLFGFGAIAREVALRAGVFGMRLVACDPILPAGDPAWQKYGVERLSMEELLRVSDVVSLHVPLTEETRHIFNAGTLSKMRKGAFLINTARGGIVDEVALATALADGSLGGAFVDVFENEPLQAGSPLAGAPNCVLTAHIAGVTRESNTRVCNMIADKVSAFLKEKS